MQIAVQFRFFFVLRVPWCIIAAENNNHYRAKKELKCGLSVPEAE
jgi:hypothetical protein